MLKSIASALEVFLTCAAAWLLFATPLDPQTLIAAALVAAGVALYARPAPALRAGYVALPLGSSIGGSDKASGAVL